MIKTISEFLGYKIVPVKSITRDNLKEIRDFIGIAITNEPPPELSKEIYHARHRVCDLLNGAGYEMLDIRCDFCWLKPRPHVYPEYSDNFDEEDNPLWPLIESYVFDFGCGARCYPTKRCATAMCEGLKEKTDILLELSVGMHKLETEFIVKEMEKENERRKQSNSSRCGRSRPRD